DLGEDLIDAILSEAGRFATEEVAPLADIGDRQGARLEGDEVRLPDGWRDLYRNWTAGGWNGLTAPEAFGGQALSHMLNVAALEMWNSGSMAFALAPTLTMGAIEAVSAHGSAALKETYLARMVSGEWTGTMNLTEPQCGTDLGLIRTKAVRQADGSYRITGTKIFISAGEHDLAENIVHLVLGRIEGAPAGTKGLSLFVVPKVVPNPDGSLGAHNAVACGSLEEKMGIHGNSTCVMNYDGATGWLVAEENHGLAAMFTMMNEARLGVGVQGLALSEVAYQNAVAYAKDRLQGRALTGAIFKDKPADPIIVHPDVRRVLMSIRAFNEAARALVMWTALKSDVARRSSDAKERESADDHMGLLTPVIKGVLTDQGFANTVAAQQVFGGHGYIKEWGMEQYVRDARIPMIYEGANGIQALDLVGRKLAKDGGRALTAFFTEVQGFVKENAGDAGLTLYVEPLGKALGHLQQATMWFAQNALAKPENAGAGATDYMHLFGLVALGYMWARMAQAAKQKLAAGANGAGERMNAKLVTGRFFVERMLPDTATHLARIQAGAASTMDLPADGF
ncbi:MAG TPA: acyl-CoA dehydrogenase C-terminal domain-containing protein, partial [Stellaceae bacterium]